MTKQNVMCADEKNLIDASIMLENAISNDIGNDITALCRSASKYKLADFKRLMLRLGYPAARQDSGDEKQKNATSVLPFSHGTHSNAVMNACLVTRYPFLLRNSNHCEHDADDSISFYSTWLDDMPVGWRASFGLELCEDLSTVMTARGVPTSSMVTEQVKEKFGSLRWYYMLEKGDADSEDLTRLDDDIADVILAYEALSSHTCVSCGSTANIRQTSCYILPICCDCHVYSGTGASMSETRQRAARMYKNEHVVDKDTWYVPDADLQGYYDRIFVEETNELGCLSDESTFVVRTLHPDGHNTERNVLDTCERHGLLINKIISEVSNG